MSVAHSDPSRRAVFAAHAIDRGGRGKASQGFTHSLVEFHTEFYRTSRAQYELPRSWTDPDANRGSVCTTNLQIFRAPRRFSRACAIAPARAIAVKSCNTDFTESTDSGTDSSCRSVSESVKSAKSVFQPCFPHAGTGSARPATAARGENCRSLRTNWEPYRSWLLPTAALHCQPAESLFSAAIFHTGAISGQAGAVGLHCFLTKLKGRGRKRHKASVPALASPIVERQIPFVFLVRPSFVFVRTYDLAACTGAAEQGGLSTAGRPGAPRLT